MKRSRSSKYDRKRNRSKKDSQRASHATSKSTVNSPKEKSTVKSNSTSSSTNASRKSNTIDRLKSFEIDEHQEKKYTHRQVIPKKKSGCFNFRLPLAGVLILFIFKIIMGIDSTTRASKTWKDDPIMLEVDRKSKNSFRNLINKNPAILMLGRFVPMRQVAHLKKDSLFPVHPNINVHLFKGFHLYDARSLPTAQLFAKFSKYYFFYDRIKKNASQSTTDQWTQLRDKLTSKITEAQFSYEDIKNYTYKGLQIEEKKFTITAADLELQGVATLIEAEDIRYFFHFISKEKKTHPFDVSYLKKYLDFYLKIK